MTNKRKKRIREHAAATGMSYQAASNALQRPERKCNGGPDGPWCGEPAVFWRRHEQAARQLARPRPPGAR